MLPLDLDLFVLLLRLCMLGLLYLFLAQVVFTIRRDLGNAARGSAPGPKSLAHLAVVETTDPDLMVGQLIGLLPTTTLGRGPHNAVTLNDTFVSSSHAVITLRGKHWWLEDLNSTNGTFLNRGQVREPTPIEFGDILDIGHVKLKLVR